MSFLKQYFDQLTSLFLESCPYILLGLGIVFVLRMVLHPEFFYRQLGGEGILPIFKAMLLGLPLPICSCGVIPLADFLYKNRVSRGAIGAFLVATPTNGIDSIMVTYGMLGIGFAILRPVAGGIIAIIVGLLLHACCEEFKPIAPQVDLSTQRVQTVADRWKEAIVELQTFFVGTGKRFVVGMIFLSPIYLLLPNDVGSISQTKHQFLIYISMLFVGMPLYICSTSSVPIGFLLLQKGFSAGTVFTLLAAGPLTNSGVIHAIMHILGKSGTALFYGTCSVLILLFAWGLDQVDPQLLLVPALHESVQIVHHKSVYIYWMQIVCTGIFFGCFAWSYKVFFVMRSTISSQNVILSVSGMVGGHCEIRVQRELESIPGIIQVIALQQKGHVQIFFQTEESVQESIRVLDKLGYAAKKIC